MSKAPVKDVSSGSGSFFKMTTRPILQATEDPLPSPTTSIAVPGSSSPFAIFELVMLVVCVGSWVLMRRRREELAKRRQQRYRRLATSTGDRGASAGREPSPQSPSAQAASPAGVAGDKVGVSAFNHTPPAGGDVELTEVVVAGNKNATATNGGGGAPPAVGGGGTHSRSASLGAV